MKPDCELKKELSAYLDGELAPERSREIRNHLDHCPACAHYAAALSLVDERIGNIPEIEPSVDFSRNFWQRVDSISRKPRFPVISQLFRGWKPALATGIGLLMMIGALFLIQQGRPGTHIEGNEMVIAEQLDLLDNYEMIRHMELLENWDTVTGDNGRT